MTPLGRLTIPPAVLEARTREPRPSLDFMFNMDAINELEVLPPAPNHTLNQTDPTDFCEMFGRAGVSKSWAPNSKGPQHNGVRSRSIVKGRRPRPAAPRNASERERRKEAAAARYACSTWDEIVDYVGMKASKHRQFNDWEEDAAVSRAHLIRVLCTPSLHH